MRSLTRFLERASSFLTRHLFGFEKGVVLRLRSASSAVVPRVLTRWGAGIGAHAQVHSPLTVHNARKHFRNLSLGDDAYVGRDCFFDLRDRIEIAARSTLSMRVTVITHLDAGQARSAVGGLETRQAPVIIEDDVYVGACVTS